MPNSKYKPKRMAAMVVVVMYVLSILSFFKNDDASFELSSASNYLFLWFSFFLFLALLGKKINSLILVIYLVAAVFFVIHSLYMVDYTVHKHLFNQLGFLSAAAVSALFLQYAAKSCRMDLALKYIVLVSFPLFFVLLFGAIAGIGQIAYSLNHWYVFIHSMIWVEKQQIGVFLAWMLIAMSVSVANKKNINYIIFLSLLLFLGIGIRSFIVGFILLLVFVFVSKYKFVRVFYVVAPFLLAFVVFSQQITIPLILFFDIRGLMLQATLDVAYQYPFGVGVGGYTEYLPEHYQFNAADYRGVSDTYRYLSRDFVLNVLESDLMVMMFTFGVFVTAIYYVASLIILDYFLRKKAFLLDRFEKAMALLFGWYLFAGMTQDYIFKLHWWVMVSFVLFVLTRVGFKQRNLAKIIVVEKS